MSPPCPGLSMEPRAGAAPSAGTWWRSCSAWGWTRWWPEGRAPVPSQGPEGPGAPRSDPAAEPPGSGGDTSSSSPTHGEMETGRASASAPGTSMGGFAPAARTGPGPAPRARGHRGCWLTLHRSQFLAITTVPASAEPVCGVRGSSAPLGLSRCCRDGEHPVWAQVCPGATHWGQGDPPAPWAGLAFKGNGGLALPCSLSSNSSSTHSLGCFWGCFCCSPQPCPSLQAVPKPLANKCEFTEQLLCAVCAAGPSSVSAPCIPLGLGANPLWGWGQIPSALWA